MARKSGILIRQLFGNWSNPCAGLLHHRRKLLPSSIQTLTLTLTLTSIPGTTPSLPPPCKLPLSSPNLHFKKRSDTGIPLFLFHFLLLLMILLLSLPMPLGPANMVIITNKDDYDRAIKQVKDDQRFSTWLLMTTHLLRIEDYCIISCYVSKLVVLTLLAYLYTDMKRMWEYPSPDYKPAFHFQLNGEKVGGIYGSDKLQDIFAELYRNVVPLKTTQPTGSSGIGEGRAEQLVIQAKKDENDKGSAEALSQRRSAATLSQLRVLRPWYRGVVALLRQLRVVLHLHLMK